MEVIQFSEAIYAYFPPATRLRGRELYNKQQVKIMHLEGQRAQALVHDSSEVFKVFIGLRDQDQDKVQVHCTCPAFKRSQEPCSHIFALALQLNQEPNFLNGAQFTALVNLEILKESPSPLLHDSVTNPLDSARSWSDIAKSPSLTTAERSLTPRNKHEYLIAIIDETVRWPDILVLQIKKIRNTEDLDFSSTQSLNALGAQPVTKKDLHQMTTQRGPLSVAAKTLLEYSGRLEKSHHNNYFYYNRLSRNALAFHIPSLYSEIEHIFNMIPVFKVDFNSPHLMSWHQSFQVADHFLFEIEKKQDRYFLNARILKKQMKSAVTPATETSSNLVPPTSEPATNTPSAVTSEGEPKANKASFLTSISSPQEALNPQKTSWNWRELSPTDTTHLYRSNQNQYIYLKDAYLFEDWLKVINDDLIEIRTSEIPGFLETVHNQNFPCQLHPDFEWPIQMALEPELKVAVQDLRPDDKNLKVSRHYQVIPEFIYQDIRVEAHDPREFIASGIERIIIQRHRSAEAQSLTRIESPWLKLSSGRKNQRLILPKEHLYPYAIELLAKGIEVEVDRKKINTQENFRFTVHSSQDWFEVDAEAEVGGRWIKLPQLLESIKRGETLLQLEDGEVAVISDRIKKKLLKWSQLGDVTKEGFQFSKNQALLLDGLLENENQVRLDSIFEAAKAKLQRFQGVRALEAPTSFKGELRLYQKEALGWISFLQDYQLGGILADDMGLGKTIQCLSYLASHFETHKEAQYLIVAPKSLLTNWLEEAAKFTPQLKCIVLIGNERAQVIKNLHQYQVIITTYQTMTRDIERLKKVEWDAVILDEAQAIKNAGTLAARCAKMIPAKFRLAMTGTPIENSIQDLISISDFVNPGFVNKKIRNLHLEVESEVRELIVKSFKPVVLRRTKEQVLKDLPSKTEQTIYVELDGKHLDLYNELKQYFQAHLLKQIQDTGLNKSRFQVLAALTRLRQAALHPGLLNANKKWASNKFEIALQMLEEILSENHKVLIYSQFTRLLTLFQKELEERNIQFSYLDGSTQDRKKVVDDFKNRADISVFLISLKAGGVGLNLVEADYVFLLDPWWNPAAENQAIDRIHRIGQTRPVHAYRFISKNTVEEKIVELQKTKRHLSDALLGQEAQTIKSLSAQDIESLFS